MSVQPHKIDELILVLLNYIAQHPNSAMASPARRSVRLYHGSGLLAPQDMCGQRVY